MKNFPDKPAPMDKVSSVPENRNTEPTNKEQSENETIRGIQEQTKSFVEDTITEEDLLRYEDEMEPEIFSTISLGEKYSSLENSYANSQYKKICAKLGWAVPNTDSPTPLEQSKYDEFYQHFNEMDEQSIIDDILMNIRFALWLDAAFAIKEKEKSFAHFVAQKFLNTFHKVVYNTENKSEYSGYTSYIMTDISHAVAYSKRYNTTLTDVIRTIGIEKMKQSKEKFSLDSDVFETEELVSYSLYEVRNELEKYKERRKKK